ncbi:hypothetical protein LDENG_00263280 [Lucifuga dentata]|nr:hypothetical protein LDENG_00263280 [Lucifuga dentata]
MTAPNASSVSPSRSNPGKVDSRRQIILLSSLLLFHYCSLFSQYSVLLTRGCNLCFVCIFSIGRNMSFFNWDI